MSIKRRYDAPVVIMSFQTGSFDSNEFYEEFRMVTDNERFLGFAKIMNQIADEIRIEKE